MLPSLAGRVADPLRPHPCRQELAISPVAVQFSKVVVKSSLLQTYKVKHSLVREIVLPRLVHIHVIERVSNAAKRYLLAGAGITKLLSIKESTSKMT
jgi:hypothetical protein